MNKTLHGRNKCMNKERKIAAREINCKDNYPHPTVWRHLQLNTKRLVMIDGKQVSRVLISKMVSPVTGMTVARVVGNLLMTGVVWIGEKTKFEKRVNRYGTLEMKIDNYDRLQFQIINY